jgi:hypothetical protein
MIAATMFSVLFIGLGSHLRGGLTVWRQTTQTVDALQRQEAALDRVAQDLAQALQFDDPREDVPLPASSFGGGQLALLTVEPSGSPGATVRRVTYECRDDGNGTALLRTSQRIGEARAGEEPGVQRLLEGCESLGLRYAYAPETEGEPLAWEDEWNFPQDVPGLVAVTLHLEGGGTPWRVIAVARGALRPRTEAEEGGG